MDGFTALLKSTPEPRQPTLREIAASRGVLHLRTVTPLRSPHSSRTHAQTRTLRPCCPCRRSEPFITRTRGRKVSSRRSDHRRYPTSHQEQDADHRAIG